MIAPLDIELPDRKNSGAQNKAADFDAVGVRSSGFSLASESFYLQLPVEQLPQKVSICFSACSFVTP